MEEPQNETSGEGAGGDAGFSKGGAKLIRGGNGADGGPEPAGKGAEARAAETASAVTGAVLHAGRRAAAGAQVARLQAEQGAEAIGREALHGAQTTAAAAEEVAADVGGDMLGELVGYAQRAYLRNTRALSELLYCRTPFGLLRWQSNLLGETMSDLTDTNARILRLSSNKA
jgi:hypothetical protein